MGHETHIPHQRGGTTAIKTSLAQCCASVCAHATPHPVFFTSKKSNKPQPGEVIQGEHCPAALAWQTATAKHVTPAAVRAVPAWGDFCVAHLSHGCLIADKAMPFRKIINSAEIQRDGEMTRVGFLIWFWFFFPAKKSFLAVTQHPCKTLMLQKSSPGQYEKQRLRAS